jgi:hypothetical protein
MGTQDVVRAPSPEPEEEPTGSASLEIKVIRAGSELGFGLKLPGEDGTGLVSACLAVAGPAATLPAAHMAGLGSSWAWGLATAQLVLAGVLAIRSRLRHHSR